jgi:hypothetical protein
VMPREKARRLCLLCLSSGPPPTNALAAEPEIAAMLDSYNLCVRLRCLPKRGALGDQDARWVEYARIFATAEAEYQKT